MNNRKNVEFLHPPLRLYDPAAIQSINDGAAFILDATTNSNSNSNSIHSISYVLYSKGIKWNVVYLTTPTSFAAAHSWDLGWAARLKDVHLSISARCRLSVVMQSPMQYYTLCSLATASIPCRILQYAYRINLMLGIDK